MKLRRRWVWLIGVIVAASTAVLMVWLPFRTGDSMLTVQAAEQTLLDQYEGEIEETKLNHDFYELKLRAETGLYHVVLDARTGTVDSIELVEAAEDTKQKTLLSRDYVKNDLQKRTKGSVDKLELTESKGRQVYEAEIKMKDGSIQQVTVDPYTGETLSTRTIQPKPKPKPKPKPNPNTKPQPPANKGGNKQGNDDKEPKMLTEAEASRIALAKYPGEVEDAELRGVEKGRPYYLIEIELKDGREVTVEVNAISGKVGTVIWNDDEPDDDQDDDDDDN
ncbi:PepSY domain-containing protein [Paenibacillus faecalis]|uniref:PepSY domain-containing protein n=1 Tax=Paenibacillus faecalis TaxID=2079532 RepID=UPI00131A5EC4|nr:PepSY domain-containing protein [Paenibacillus faecalis]